MGSKLFVIGIKFNEKNGNGGMKKRREKEGEIRSASAVGVA